MTEPLNPNVLWLNGSKLFYYEGGWVPLTEGTDDKEKKEIFDSNLPLVIKGKFKADADEADYKCKIEGKDVAITVNPDTKEFVYVVQNNVNSIADLFAGNTSIEELTVSGNPMATDIHSMCSNASSLKKVDLSNLNASHSKDASYLFCDAAKIQEMKFPKIKIKTNNFDSVFDACNVPVVDVSCFDTSECTSFKGVFNNTTALFTNLSKLDTHNVTTMYGCFMRCMGTPTLNLSGWDTSSLTDISDMLHSSKVVTLIVNMGLSNCTKIGGIAAWDWYLAKIRGKMYNIKVSLSFTDNSLDKESAKIIIDGLATVSTKQTLRFSTYTGPLLTDEQKAEATAKGWTLTY